MAKVLIIDDEPGVCWALQQALQNGGHVSEAVGTAEQGLPRAAEFDLVFLDIGLPGMNGLDALNEIDGVPVVIITAHGTVDNAVDALKRGAFDYLVKPLRAEDIPALVARAVKRTALEREVTRLRGELAGRSGEGALQGTTRVMQEVFKSIATVAMSDAPVLILGESGTGKELVARTIHEASARSAEAFEPIDCGALPEPLLESELFGHERGAFTGAVARKRGRLERADRGTLFLAEIGELTPPSQVKLLRFLAEREVQRLGGQERHAIDTRVITATHRDLRALLETGDFREDLYYRLAVTEIRLPPLRDRRDDIPLLVAHFLEQLGYGGELSEAAMAAFTEYTWPGNVRELRNAVEAATVVARGAAIEPDHLPGPVLRGGAALQSEIEGFVARLADGAPDGAIFHTVQEQCEAAMLRHVLHHVGHNQVQASKRLGIHRTTLRKLIAKYEIQS